MSKFSLLKDFTREKKKGVCYDTKRILEGWDIEHMEEMEKFQQDVLT